jgi:RNA polymerase sigma-70 factor (ECF subfamily)
VIYFVFNEGYEATSGSSLTNADLCREAIRLGRILVDLAPQEAEARGLLSLMVLHDARRSARTDTRGNLVTLEWQDRELWDNKQIQEGITQLNSALKLGSIGPYQIQAAISAVHVQSQTYEQTDWKQITLLYDKLYDLHPSPVVKLNRTVAFSFANSPERALTAIKELEDEGALDTYQPFHAARADVFRRAGRKEKSAEAFRRALDLTNNHAERRFLEQRIMEVLE